MIQDVKERQKTLETTIIKYQLSENIFVSLFAMQYPSFTDKSLYRGEKNCFNHLVLKVLKWFFGSFRRVVVFGEED